MRIAWSLALAVASSTSACRGGEHRDPAAGALGAQAEPAATTPDARTAIDPGAKATPTMTNAIVRDTLQPPLDLRISRTLELPLADDVVIAFYQVAMAKSPATNYRYELHRDGRLFYVQHSRTPGDWQQPFDRPLPRTPARTLAAVEVTALLGTLEAAGFFDHPGYEANPKTQDGSHWVVRARRGNDVHTVVFQNTKPDYFGALTAISDPLWTP